MLSHFVLKWLSPALVFLSLLVKRDNDKYVFGEWFGQTDRDNSKYIFDSALRDGSKKVLWITKSREVYGRLRALNVPVHLAYSLPGIFHQMTSKYFICSVSSRDFNCFTCGFGAKIIMLGHGLPIKKQSDHFSLPQRLKRHIRFLTIDRYYKSASESAFFDEISHQQFNLSIDSVIRMPTARCDIYSVEFDGNQRQSFMKNNGISEKDLNVIYLPTHRNEGKDVAVILKVVGELDAIADILNKKYKIAIKFHIKVHHYDSALVSQLYYKNVNLLDFSTDLNGLFRISDLFIGDYSGVCYDFIFFKKPMIAYVPDFYDYVSSNRKLYMKLEDIYGAVSYSQKELLLLLDRYMSCFPNHGTIYLPKYERNLPKDTSLSAECWRIIKSC